MTKDLQVMKFGGTSVGDATCIRRSAQIAATAAIERPVVVVVSEMSGVTNRLIEAANRARAGDRDAGKTLCESLRKQHLEVLTPLVAGEAGRTTVQGRIEEILSEAARLYEGTALL